MTTKFYVDANGNYLGGYDGVTPPSGSYEVPVPPDDARQVWDANAQVWLAVVIPVPAQITQAPTDLFGGPTLGELFNVD